MLIKGYLKIICIIAERGYLLEINLNMVINAIEIVFYMNF